MSSKFSKEQLEKLALHTTGINNILLEALLSPSPEEPEDGEREVELEIHVVEIDNKSKPQK
jgi:hypothetical protein